MKLLSNQQRLHLVNTEQLFESYSAAYSSARAYANGMRWKVSNGAEYLFREQDRRGNGKSLGRRSPETEALLEKFQSGKAAAQARLAQIRAQIDEQARLNKALRLARVPRVIGRVLRELHFAGVQDSFTVLGTQALYAYEVAGGGQFLLELLASGDIDPLYDPSYDPRKQLALVSAKMDGLGLLGLLKKADRTFECIRKRGFRAANAGSFMVDLIVPPQGMKGAVEVTFGEGDLVAAEVPGLQWLLNAPKLDAVAVDEDGWPVPLRVPDPRAFALHKAWLSAQLDREPLKKPRDIAQAKAVAELVISQMPHLRFAETLTSLHGDVRNMAGLLDLPEER